MRLTLLSSAAIALTLMAAPQFAAAQSAPANATAEATTPALPATAPAMNDQPSAATATAAASDVSASEPAIPMSSPTPADQQSTLTANSPSVVSNGPVADTAENRAKYGSPMSNAGKRTAARGN